VQGEAILQKGTQTKNTIGLPRTQIYARSFKAADIRPIVQQYNFKRGEIDAQEAEERRRKMEERANAPDLEPDDSRGGEEDEVDWNAFVEPEDKNEDEGESDITTGQIKGFRLVGVQQEQWEEVGGKLGSWDFFGGRGRSWKKKLSPQQRSGEREQRLKRSTEGTGREKEEAGQEFLFSIFLDLFGRGRPSVGFFEEFTSFFFVLPSRCAPVTDFFNLESKFIFSEF
jgi:hypothetical protein